MSVLVCSPDMSRRWAFRTAGRLGLSLEGWTSTERFSLHFRSSAVFALEFPVVGARRLPCEGGADSGAHESISLSDAYCARRARFGEFGAVGPSYSSCMSPDLRKFWSWSCVDGLKLSRGALDSLVDWPSHVIGFTR